MGQLVKFYLRLVRSRCLITGKSEYMLFSHSYLRYYTILHTSQNNWVQRSTIRRRGVLLCQGGCVASETVLLLLQDVNIVVRDHKGVVG